MGVLTIKVPDVGEGIAEVELVSWAVTKGQPVTRNQIIAEVMTDKATVEVPAPVDGVVEGLTGGVGDVLLVGSPLFTLQVEGEPDTPTEEPRPRPKPEHRKSPAAEQAAVEPPSAPMPVTTPVAATGPPRAEGRRPTATPAVRRRARDGGIDLRTVTGTGPAGRITHDDLDVVSAGTNGRGVAGPSRQAGPRTAGQQVTDQPIVGIRRKIAEQMVASASTIPHITYVDDVDMTALEELRASLNASRPEGQPKLTILPFLVRALVNHLPEFPQMNAHVLGPEEAAPDDGPTHKTGPAILRAFEGVHVGIAAQTDAGLVVPVLRHAETETIWSVASRVEELAATAKAGTASRDDLTGSTITITSLGALGGLVTTPVINKPETTIIGVNKMVTAPVWIDGAFVPRKMMNLSSSFDHRVIDGWDAARFIQAVKQSLEQPAMLFVDQP